MTTAELGFALMNTAIPLKHSARFAIISQADAALACEGWLLHTNGYARSVRKPAKYLHRRVAERAGWLTSAPVDHVSGDPLDNRRENLRDAGASGNARNQTRKSAGSSRFKGVHWARDRSMWRACICVNYRTIHLGSFETEVAAQQAYASAALKYFGAFAAPFVEAT